MKNYVLNGGDDINEAIKNMLALANQANVEVSAEFNRHPFTVKPGDLADDVYAKICQAIALRTDVQGFAFGNWMVVIPGKSMPSEELVTEMEKRHLRPVTQERLEALRSYIDTLIILQSGVDVQPKQQILFA